MSSSVACINAPSFPSTSTGSAPRQSFLVTLTRPNAQAFGTDYGLSYGGSLLARFGVRVDPSLRLEPFIDDAAQTVTYTLKVSASPAQMAAAVNGIAGLTAERERLDYPEPLVPPPN